MPSTEFIAAVYPGACDTVLAVRDKHTVAGSPLTITRSRWDFAVTLRIQFGVISVDPWMGVENVAQEDAQ
jgi:hypothetical protein